MAASSSSNPCNSNPTLCWKYHVFLSFRGGDTRHNFTDRLYDALCDSGILTFRDDEELARGEVIKPELLQAIEESLCAIVILSENYASSSWCLDELQKILECTRVSGRWVLPVFYGIDPSVVRHQTGSFDDAFKKHEEKFGEDETKVQKWRSALSEVANISGYHSENQSEGELIKKIIRDLWTKVEPHLPPYEDGLVGIDSKLEDMRQILEIGLSDVRFVGIWGLGGMGKTTLARLVFDKFHSYFDFSCCLENVRERSSAMDGLRSLQSKLLSKLKIGSLEIDNVDQGKATIRNLLCRRKVLLVLDDVDDIRQLEYLVGKQDWFGNGSRVIVTTRNKHLLDSHEAPFGMYEIQALDYYKSLILFSQKAFKENQPKEGYVELSYKFLQYCKGLPLALKVLGSHLCGRDISIWEDAFENIRKNPPKDIMDTLRISFEGLEDAQKNIFLDIACFFRGWDKNRVMQILEICGFYPKIGIEILIERSLLTCDNETFGMHDLVQEMGRNIVKQKSGYEKGKQNRLWYPKDIDDVLGKNTGTEFIEGVVLKEHNYKVRCDPEAFSKMYNLRVLIIFHDLHFPLGLKCLSNSIKVLEWSEYPLPSLPLGVKSTKLVELKLRQSKIKQLWNGSQDFENLKLIDLSFSKDLICTPNFFGAPNLESLILEGCSNLVEIHPSVGQLKKLVILNLKDCINLKYLPRQLETDCLKVFNLCGCSKVQKLDKFVENIKKNKSLEILDLSETPMEEVPSLDGGFQHLQWLYLRGCGGSISKPWWKLWGSPMPMGLKLPPLSSLPMLKELEASYCNLSSESVPVINCLPSLEILRLSGNNLSGNSILLRWKFSQFSGLSKLKELDLSNCSLNDESIPDDLSYLPSLEQLILCRNNFVNLPRGFISNLTCLRRLNLDSCSKLQALPVFPPSLNSVVARDCGPIKLLPKTQLLKLLMSRADESIRTLVKRPDESIRTLVKTISVCTSTRFLRPGHHSAVMREQETEFVNKGAIIVGNKIPAWFHQQQHVLPVWKFDDYQGSIIVNIPGCCRSARRKSIGFCFIFEACDNADLYKGLLHDPSWYLHHGFASPTTATPPLGGYANRQYYGSFNRSHQFINVVNYDLFDASQIELFFGVCYTSVPWEEGGPIEKLNIRKCGWRVICEHEKQRKATMSDRDAKRTTGPRTFANRIKQKLVRLNADLNGSNQFRPAFMWID